MLFFLKNDKLTVTLSEKGGEIVSVKDNESCEYIWQGDPAFWTGQTPILFPICGRLFEGKYTYRGKTYEMGNHGFVRHSMLRGEQIDDTTVRFVLSANEDTRAVYPFDFTLIITYTLEGDKLSSSLSVINDGEEILPFAVGLHPGFNVPLDTGDFSDWYLEFAEECSPDRILHTDACFLTGKRTALPVEGGRIFRLRHDLFLIDGIFMSNLCQQVTLKSDKSRRSILFSFPDMPYLGIWHKPRTEAPYVCIEPWCGLPSFDGQVDDIENKADMFRLLPKSEKTVSYSLIFR